MLCIPATPESSCESKNLGKAGEGGCDRAVDRRIGRRDAGNVQGWYGRSSDGYGRHDLRMMPPEADCYLAGQRWANLAAEWETHRAERDEILRQSVPAEQGLHPKQEVR